MSLSSVSLDSSRKFQLVPPSLPTPRKRKIQQVAVLSLCYCRCVVRNARHLAVCLQYVWPFVRWSLRENNSRKGKEADFRDFNVRSAWRPSERSVTQNKTIWFTAPLELVYNSCGKKISNICLFLCIAFVRVSFISDVFRRKWIMSGERHHTDWVLKQGKPVQNNLDYPFKD